MNNGNEYYGVDKVNCLECGGTYIEKSDTLKIIDPYVGRITINGVPYYHCDKCEDILYTEAMTQAIESKRTNLIKEILNGSPIKDFLSAAETALILGISRQALHKNRRINHGFIYHIKFGGSNVYLKQSVLNYKSTCDGRFPLYQHTPSLSSTYFSDNIPIRDAPDYTHSVKTRKTESLFTEAIQISQKEYYYASE